MFRTELTRAHGLAWIYLCLLLGAHVGEEALGGFLEVFNPFGVTFRFWIATLTLAVTALLAAAPLVSRGTSWAPAASYAFGAAMIANGVNHLLSPLYFGRFLPGQFTSPLLIAASIWLIVKARAVARATPSAAAI
jgi:hypothetical protein